MQQQEEENVIKELRAKQRKDRRAVESKDGLIEDNIHCKRPCSLFRQLLCFVTHIYQKWRR